MYPTNREIRVFLCHASRTKPIVYGLFHKLDAEPWILFWLNEEKLLPGEECNSKIKKAVEASDAVVVCSSNDKSKASLRISKSH